MNLAQCATCEKLREEIEVLKAKLSAKESKAEKKRAAVEAKENKFRSDLIAAGLDAMSIVYGHASDTRAGYIYILVWDMIDGSNILRSKIIKCGYTTNVKNPTEYLFKRYNPWNYKIIALEYVSRPKSVEILLKRYLKGKYRPYAGSEWFLIDRLDCIQTDVTCLRMRLEPHAKRVVYNLR